MKEKVHKLSINLTAEDHAKIKLLSAKNKISIKKLVLDAIENYESTDKLIKAMKHKIYRLEYDADENN